MTVHIFMYLLLIKFQSENMTHCTTCYTYEGKLSLGSTDMLKDRRDK